MGKSWPKLIRDPVHDIISFEDKPWDRLLLKLINTREFQRLRRIKQLGMSEMVFPGANHSRFAHSIGVMHNARRFLTRIEQLTGVQITEDQRTAVLVAALLHDLGHGPFSHTFEKITSENHETRTIEVIIDNSTEVNRVLRDHHADLPALLRQFFDEDPDAAANGGLPAHFVQIVSSQLDADRFDYLLRDAHSTGADYGKFDSRWIIQHLVLDESHNRLHLSNKAYIAAETYVFARYHMYRAVYFHKTTRAAEVMLRLMFARYKELVAKASKKKKASVVPSTPPAIVAAFTAAGKMTLSDYLQLDDHAVTQFLKGCVAATDKTLAQLAGGILDRKLFKAVDVTDAEEASRQRFWIEAGKVLERAGFDPESFLILDTPADTAYKPYDPDAEKPATQIYVEDSLGAVKEFGTLSNAVAELRRKYTLIRYYYPEDVREEMDAIASKHLRREKK
jgi:HD superfamily phosphohydrolase